MNDTALKIFNQGGSPFKVYGIEIPPGRFTEIPETAEYNGEQVRPADHVRLMMTKPQYKNAIVTDDTARAAGRAKDNRISELQAENAELKDQVRKLQQLLSPGSKSGNEVDTLGNEKTPPAIPTKGKK